MLWFVLFQFMMLIQCNFKKLLLQVKTHTHKKKNSNVSAEENLYVNLTGYIICDYFLTLEKKTFHFSHTVIIKNK